MLIQNFDYTILIFIKNNMHSSIMDNIMIGFTTLGNNGMIWIMITIFLLINKKYRKAGFMLLVAISLSTILGEGIIKHIVQRQRPFTHIPGLKLLISRPNGYSFPSGHSAVGFASAIILSKNFKKYTPSFFLIASLIAFSRLYLYVHYPTDVICGIGLGVASAMITIYIFNKGDNKTVKREKRREKS